MLIFCLAGANAGIMTASSQLTKTIVCFFFPRCHCINKVLYINKHHDALQMPGEVDHLKPRKRKSSSETRNSRKVCFVCVHNAADV